MPPTAEDNHASAKRSREEIIYRFTSNDGHEFTMEKSAAMLSGLVKQMVQDLNVSDEEAGAMQPIPMINVSSTCMPLIVKWCEKHKTMPEWEEEKWWLNSRDAAMTKWEDDFMAVVDELLFELFCAANYMDIKCLTDKCADTVALMIRGKNVEEIRKIWMLENDFTPEEEEEMKNENPWEVILRDMGELNTGHPPERFGATAQPARLPLPPVPHALHAAQFARAQLAAVAAAAPHAPAAPAAPADGAQDQGDAAAAAGAQDQEEPAEADAPAAAADDPAADADQAEQAEQAEDPADAQQNPGPEN